MFLLMGVVVEAGNIVLPKILSRFGGGDGEEEQLSLSSA